MSILKTDFLKFGEDLYEVVPPAPSEEDRGGVIASPTTEAETIEAKLGDDGKLYVAADTAGSAAAALALAEQNTQTKIDELSSSVDGKLAGKAATAHNHTIADVTNLQTSLDALQSNIDGKSDNKHGHKANEITVMSPLENSQGSSLDVVLEDFDSVINGKAYNVHSHDSDNITYEGASGNIIGKGDTLTKILQGYDQKMTSVESNVSNHSHNASNINFSAKNFSSTTADDVQSAIEHVDERIGTINDELSQSIEELANNKANTTHEHAITDVDGLQAALDAKADSNHTHNQYATTSHKHLAADITYDGFTGNYFESGDNLLNILETFDEAVYSKADASALAGKADVTHGHDASEIAFDSSTKEITGDTVLEALENADLAISNKADRVHSHVASNITDLQTKLDSTLESSKGYTDEKVALLLNNSSEAVDSIMELATAMQENEDVVNALEQAIGNKADKTHNHTTADIEYRAPAQVLLANTLEDALMIADDIIYELQSGKADKSTLTSHTDDSKIHVTQADKDAWNSKADATALSGKADKGHNHAIADITNLQTTLDGKVNTADIANVAYIDVEDNEDVADTTGGSNIVVDSALSTTSTNPVQNKVVTEKFSQMQSQITDQLGETIPDYWKEFIDGKESVIKEKLDEGGVDAFPILWGADIHGSKGASNTNGAGTSVTKNIGLIARYTLDKYKAPYAMFSGDIHSQASHTSVESVEAEYEAIAEILSPINEDELLVEKGNHDGAWGAPVDGVYYLKNIGGKKIYNRLFRRQSLDRNRVFGGDGSYFYVDSPQNVRIIMLNGHTDGDGSVDADGNAVYNSMKNGVYGTEQLKWLCDVALNVSEGTRIIVSAHQPFSSSKDGELLAGILEAYNKRISYNGTKNVQNDYWGKDVTDTTYTNVSVNADFSEAKGKVVIYLHGHIHKDTIDATSYSFAVASITTAGADVRDTDPPLRTPNTATETALDFVIMSKTAINFIRIGAGSDRVIALDDTVYYSIKNNLTNVKNSNSAGNIVAGNSYSATISANTGYELESVVVTMGGVDVTNEVYADGVITISEVIGNVVITASATKIEEDEPTDTYVNKMVVQESNLNKRISGNYSIASGNGVFICDPIEVDLTKECPVIFKNFASTMGARGTSQYGNSKVSLLDSSKSALATWYIGVAGKVGVWACPVSESDCVGDLSTILNYNPEAGTKPSASDVKYVVFAPAINSSAITMDSLNGHEIQMLVEGSTPSYTNLYDAETMATDEYLNKRINSSGNYVSATNYFSTPFIEIPTPINTNETMVVEVKGDVLTEENTSSAYCRIITYSGASHSNVLYGTSGSPLTYFGEYQYDETRDVHVFTLVNSSNSAITHIRMTLHDVGKVNEVIVTVNEPIE